MKRIISLAMLAMLMVSTFVLALGIQPAKASGTIYIRADGSIDPPDAPISTFDNVTYILTGNIHDEIEVQRDNIIVDGNGFTLQGTGIGTGLLLKWRSNVTVKNTVVTGFDFGMYLFYSNENSLVNNTCSNMGQGIVVHVSSGNILAGNRVSNNDFGIQLASSSYNNLTSNTVSNNMHGVYLSFSYGNILFHNDFITNMVQAYSGDSYNTKWDDGYPSGGNYWSGYNGTDLFAGAYQNETRSDGIGDFPYVIDADNVDHYPLMAPRATSGKPQPARAFWLLGLESAPWETDVENMILELIKHRNWNNSTSDYVSHIALLSDTIPDRILDAAKPYLRGNTTEENVKDIIQEYANGAAPGDVVIIVMGAHGSLNLIHLWPCFYESWSQLLCLGGLKNTFMTIIIDSCQSGSSIDNGSGGVLGTYYRNVLCACRSDESSYGVFNYYVAKGFTGCHDSNNDGWISAAEVFNYAKPLTEQLIGQWDNESHPVSYYDMFGGDIPLAQIDPTKPLDLPPLAVLISPEDLAVYANLVPLTLFINKPVQSINYSLDGNSNVTISRNITLSNIAEGVHSIVVYATDASGNVGKSRMIHFKIGTLLVASFVWNPKVAKLDQCVSFDASTSVFGGGIMKEYKWDFGDGQNATGNTVAHAYTNLGTYTVTLTIAESQLWDFGGTEVWVSLEATEQKQIQVVLGSTLDFENETLNLKSKTGYVFACLGLPEGYNVADINVSTIMLNGTIPAEPSSTAIGDYDNDGVPDLMVKFNRVAVSELVLTGWIKYGNVTLTVSGKLNYGVAFEGSDTIRVRMPGDINCDGKVDVKDVSAAGLAYGSSAGHPRWDSSADENEDGKIDVRDMALIAREFGRSYR